MYSIEYVVLEIGIGDTKVKLEIIRRHMRLKNVFFAASSVIVLSVVLAPDAHAYLDPGTGSYIIQLVLAALFGGLFAIKMFWAKIAAFFRKAFSAKNKNG